MHQPLCGRLKVKKCTLNCETDADLQDVDAEKVIQQYGPTGLYQILGYYLVVLFNFHVAITYFVMPFVTKNVSMTCEDESNNTISMPNATDVCLLTDGGGVSYKCGERGSHLYLSENVPVQSMITEFRLGCTHSLIKEAGYSSFTIGAMVAVPVISHLADRFGRKLLFAITIVVSAVSSMLCAVVPSYWMFVALRTIVGISTDGLATISSILSCELVMQEMRPYVGLVYTFAWAAGYFYVGLLSVFATTWRQFYVLSSLPALASLGVVLFVPESPHWLAAQNKYCHLRDYICKCTHFNKQTIDLDKCRISDSRKLTRNEAEKSGNQYKRAFTKPIFYAYILINGFIQFVSQLYYFALTLSSLNLSSDPFMGFMLSGAIEIPGGLVVIPLMKYLGRKPLVVSSLFLQGIFIAVFPFVKDGRMAALGVALNLLGKLANGVLQVTHPILVAEMMPTKMRTVMYSVVNVPQSLGILLAPYVQYMTFGYAPMPMLNLAILSLCSGALSILLPETKGKRLPEDIEEMDEGILGACCGRKRKKEPAPDDTAFGVPDIHQAEKTDTTHKTKETTADTKE